MYALEVTASKDVAGNLLSCYSLAVEPSKLLCIEQTWGYFKRNLLGFESKS